MQHDWNRITSLAYEEIINTNIPHFPIQPQKIKFPNIMMLTYQKYARLADIPIEDVSLGHELDDAYVVNGLRPGLSLILYNKDKIAPRVSHTLWHEMGHIRCGHARHGDFEEVEANYFAGQCNAPNVLIKELRNRGYYIDVGFLMECFGISKPSAEKKMDYLSRYPDTHKNMYDDLILCTFSNYLNQKYPAKRISSSMDSYFDELENERLAW